MRMRRGSGPGQNALDDGQSRPHARAAARPAVHDEQLGKIFRNMRLSMKASREAIARRLTTSTTTLDNLEAGAIAALPHWKETVRIVRAYCELLRLDPEPILWRIRSQLQALAANVTPAHQPSPHPAEAANASRGAPRPHSAARADPSGPGQHRRRRRGRAMLALSAPIALAAVVVYLVQLAPRPVYRAAALLPSPIEIKVRAGLDYLMLLTAPRRDGLTWIEVDDPRTRKTDRLQPGTR